MTIPNTTYRVLVEKLGDSDPSQFIGNGGEVFYDPNNPILKLSDGTTSGGVSIGGTGGGGGTQGVQGLQGTQGNQGVQGLSNQGNQGVQGLQGLQGTQGNQGVQGLSNQGNQGNQGLQGTQGTYGDQGVQGLLGDQGVQGLLGDQGTQGTYGDQGVQGLLGDQGTQGTYGDQGTQGLLGDQGTQGTYGDQGVQGTYGDQGVQGTYGDQGVQGIQGVQGATGGGESYWELNNVGIHTLSNVGIGTTNPTSTLTVVGDAKISDIKISGTEIIGNGIDFGQNLGSIQLIPNETLGNSYGQYVNIRPTTSGDQKHIHIEAGDANNADLYLGNDDRFVKIDYTGPVVIGVPEAGISTASWTATSTGTDIISITVIANTNPWIEYVTIGDTITLPDSSVVTIVDRPYGDIVIVGTAISFTTGDNLVFSYKTRTEWKFNPDSSAIFPGNVGIGTTNATSTLTVVGDALITGVTTSQNGFTSGIGVTDPVQITVSGNILIFTVVGVGSTSLTLY